MSVYGDMDRLPAVRRTDVNNEKLITLSNLIHYDEQLKKWVIEQLPALSSGLVFEDRDKFPAQGQENILYIAEDSIYKWDSVKNTYVNISSGSGGDAPTWSDI